jgi:hypothetical protein
MIIQFTKGQHWTYPIYFRTITKFKKKIFECEFEFNDSMKYRVKDNDRKDWSKLTGVAYNILNARKNSVMLGWRYLHEYDTFECTPYWHNKSGTAIYGTPAGYSHIRFNSGDKMKVVINYDSVVNETFISIYKNGVHIETQGLPIKPGWMSREINTWFGGSDPAYQNMYLWKFIKVKKK